MSKRFSPVPFWWGLFGVAIVAVLVRGWAEYRVGAIPLGYDSSTSYVENYGAVAPTISNLGLFNLLYWMYGVLDRVGVPAFLGVKLVGTVLYALLGVLMTLVARRVFKVTVLGSVTAGIVTILSLGGLRFGWDLHRNMLGVVMALATILLANEYWRSKQWYWLGAALFFALLTLLSHQLAAAALLTVGVGALAAWISNKMKAPMVVTYIIWLGFIVLGWQFAKGYMVGDFRLITPIAESQQRTEISHTLELAWLVFGPLLGLVGLIGIYIRKSKILSFVTIVLAAQGLSALFVPTSAFSHWDRWLYFLTFPLVMGVAVAVDSYVARYSGWKRIWIASICVLAVVAPSYRMIVSKHSLYERKDVRGVFNTYPAALQSNALAANPVEVKALRELPSCTEELLTFGPKNPILIPEQYYPVMLRLLANNLDRIAVNAAPQQGWFAIGYPYRNDKRFVRITGVSANCYLFIAK